MMFRRSMLDLLMPADPGRIRICADHYLMSLAHFFSGSLVLGEVLGAYRRHGRNTFATLPVLGYCGALAPGNGKTTLDENYRLMHDHVREHYETFASIFGNQEVRKFLGMVKRYLVAEARRVNFSRLVAPLRTTKSASKPAGLHRLHRHWLR
jgi:hypothetical protein